MIRIFLTTVRQVLRRPAFWLLVWAYRHVGALWARSIADELRRPGRFDGERFRFLIRSLWLATTNTGFAVQPPAHKLSVVDAVHNGAKSWTVASFDLLIDEPNQPGESVDGDLIEPDLTEPDLTMGFDTATLGTNRPGTGDAEPRRQQR